MRVNANGKVYDVRWSRIRQGEDGTVIHKGEKREVVSVDTNCSISEVDETKTGAAKYTGLAMRTAFLGKKDSDDRRVGRKVALTKVLKDVFPSNKVIRTVFWEAYRKQYNK